MIGIDTNVLLCFLLKDYTPQSARVVAASRDRRANFQDCLVAIFERERRL